MSSLPDRIAERFGSPRARPRLTAVYRPESGWQKVDHPTPITEDRADQLRRAGVTMVELRWHLKVQQISLQQPAHLSRQDVQTVWRF